MVGRMLQASLVALLALAFTGPALAAFGSDHIIVSVEGQGPDVILVPGLTSSPAAWSMVTPKLPGHRFHFVQVKGFAGVPNEGNRPGELVSEVAEEVARYIAEEKVTRPAIVGHSMGGTVALMVAARHPEAVSRAMVVDQVPAMGVMFTKPGANAADLAAAGEAQKARLSGMSLAEYENAMSASTGSMVSNAEMRPQVVQEALASDRALVAGTMGELVATDLRPELAKIAAPVTVLYVTPAVPGVTDAMIDGLYAQSYEPLEGVTLVRVPASAHFIMYDNPDRFVDEFKAFMAR